LPEQLLAKSLFGGGARAHKIRKGRLGEQVQVDVVIGAFLVAMSLFPIVGQSGEENDVLAVGAVERPKPARQ